MKVIICKLVVMLVARFSMRGTRWKRFLFTKPDGSGECHLVTNSWVELVSCLLLPSLQSGMNLQICFVNDSGSDKDSDADDSKTETSLDTPLSPMVSPPPLELCVCVWFPGPSASFFVVSQEKTWQRFKKKCLLPFLDIACSSNLTVIGKAQVWYNKET